MPPTNIFPKIISPKEMCLWNAGSHRIQTSSVLIIPGNWPLLFLLPIIGSCWSTQWDEWDAQHQWIGPVWLATHADYGHGAAAAVEFSFRHFPNFSVFHSTNEVCMLHSFSTFSSEHRNGAASGFKGLQNFNSPGNSFFEKDDHFSGLDKSIGQKEDGQTTGNKNQQQPEINDAGDLDMGNHWEHRRNSLSSNVVVGMVNRQIGKRQHHSSSLFRQLFWAFSYWPVCCWPFSTVSSSTNKASSPHLSLISIRALHLAMIPHFRLVTAILNLL